MAPRVIPKKVPERDNKGRAQTLSADRVLRDLNIVSAKSPSERSDWPSRELRGTPSRRGRMFPNPNLSDKRRTRLNPAPEQIDPGCPGRPEPPRCASDAGFSFF